MQFTVVSLLAFAAAAAAQCSYNKAGKFTFTPANVSQTEALKASPPGKRAVVECPESPTVTLRNGILIDQRGFQGEVVSNTQFQFDPILQSKRVLDQGFCILENNTLAVAGNGIFYSCISNTEFANIYTTDIGSVCSQLYLQVSDCVGGPDVPDILSVDSQGPASTTPPVGGATEVPSSADIPSTTSSMSTPTATPVNTVPTEAPYPVGNSTTPSASGSGTGLPTTTAGPSSTSPAAYNPANGANALAISSQLVAGIAAVGALFIF